MSNPSNRSLNRKMSVRDLLTKVKLLKDKNESKESLRNLIFRKAEDTSFWVNDELIDFCFSCNNQFTTFRRKHHCRLCGRIYCHSCTLHVPGIQFGFNGPVRVCVECFRNLPKPVVQEGLQPVSLHRNSSVETFDVYSSDSDTEVEPFMSFTNVNEPEIITYDVQLRRSTSSHSHYSNTRRRSVSSQSSIHLGSQDMIDPYSQNLLYQLATPIFGPHCQIACDLAWNSSQMVNVSCIQDAKDILKIKSFEGSFSQSHLINAFVFSKAVAHNQMPSSILNPNILLVAFPLNFYKKEFTSLENLLNLEREFLTKLVDRISSLSPNLIICSQSVSRLVVEMLTSRQIALISNVKPPILKRLSVILKSNIITSIDRLAINPVLGTCGSFNVELINRKSLIFLKQCNYATILCYGGNNYKSHLKSLCIYAYSLRLEHSLLLDAQCHISPPPPNFQPHVSNSINVLYLTSTHNNGILCIDLYTSTDTTLGQYIEDVVYESKSNPSVVKKYGHEQRLISISCSKTELTNSSSSITMHTICNICKVMTSPVLINDLTWRLSFGKWLEMHYYNTQFTMQCGHLLFIDSTIYYTFDTVVVKVATEQVTPFKLLIPLIKPQEPPVSKALLDSIAMSIVNKISAFYTYLSLKLKSQLTVLMNEINDELIQQTETEFNELQHKCLFERVQVYKEFKMLYESGDCLECYKFMHTLNKHVNEWNSVISNITMYLTGNNNRKSIMKMIQDTINSTVHFKVNNYEVANNHELMVYPTIGEVVGATNTINDMINDLILEAVSKGIYKFNKYDQSSAEDSPGFEMPVLGSPCEFNDQDIKSDVKEVPVENQFSLTNPNEFYSPSSGVMMVDGQYTLMIAYGLLSKQYIEQLVDIPDEMENDLKGFKEMMQSVEELDEIQKPYIVGEQHHAKIVENDPKFKYDLTIYYAKQFKNIRINCEIETWYLDSLLKNMEMTTIGSKSKSYFIKTNDDRFIMKSLPKHEFEAFLRFAPFYFEYMNRALFHGLPTALAKIFGCYKINYKNVATGSITKMDVVLMENIFFNRKINKLFDLKGSFRNRHVGEGNNEVLYDENLLETMHVHPLFINERDKRIIRASIWNDTLFLQSQNVMDYSILVGIVEGSHELVVGVVDYIRTYTWDKKLETVFKERGGSLIGENREPTIISPKQYKKRFRDCVEKYFLLLPDKDRKATTEIVENMDKLDSP